MKKDKISAFHKITRTIQGSRNDLHLHTCSIMIGFFLLRFKDEELKMALKNEMDLKRGQIMANRYTMYS